MNILPANLVDMGVRIATATRWAGPVNAAMAKYEINTPVRIAAFLAQILHESGRFVYVRELWGPTAAQRGYEGRKDLGNVHKGDGKRYMGRGLIQITGRTNYQELSDALGVNFLDSPILLEKDEHAVMSAAWFWHDRGLNEYADKGDFLRITKRINGGTNGLADRQDLWALAKKSLGVK